MKERQREIDKQIDRQIRQIRLDQIRLGSIRLDQMKLDQIDRQINKWIDRSIGTQIEVRIRCIIYNIRQNKVNYTRMIDQTRVNQRSRKVGSQEARQIQHTTDTTCNMHVDRRLIDRLWFLFCQSHGLELGCFRLLCENQP